MLPTDSSRMATSGGERESCGSTSIRSWHEPSLFTALETLVQIFDATEGRSRRRFSPAEEGTASSRVEKATTPVSLDCSHTFANGFHRDRSAMSVLPSPPLPSPHPRGLDAEQNVQMKWNEWVDRRHSSWAKHCHRSLGNRLGNHSAKEVAQLTEGQRWRSSS